MEDKIEFLHRTAVFDRETARIPQIILKKCGGVVLRCWQVPMRSTSCWHLYWNTTPGARLILPEKVFEMNSNHLYLLPSYLMFATNSISSGRIEHNYIDFQLNDLYFSRLKREVFEFSAEKFLLQLTDCFQSRIISGLAAVSLIFTLLLRISPDKFTNENEPPIDHRLLIVLDEISKALSLGDFSNLNNYTLSRKAGMSLSNFEHLFQRVLKISPRRYILNRRLEQASELLRNSSKTIEEIAEITGFATRYQFTRSFTQTFHDSPAHYRKKSACNLYGRNCHK